MFVGGVGVGGTLYAVDEQSGSVRWSADVENGKQQLARPRGHGGVRLRPVPAELRIRPAQLAAGRIAAGLDPGSRALTLRFEALTWLAIAALDHYSSAKISRCRTLASPQGRKPSGSGDRKPHASS